jgi:GNAT superfamily N-acetyltransferase
VIKSVASLLYPPRSLSPSGSIKSPNQLLTTSQLFCQNLCQFAKFFLDTKSVVYETMGFRFYIHTVPNPTSGRRHVTGFFSKEKKSWDDYNLACILVLSPYHRQGIGKTLIAFSYELSRREKKMGSPEKRKVPVFPSFPSG